jgi:hypothetical protein
MTPADYLEALHRAGILEDLPTKELDRQASLVLRVDIRTARRYRRGEVSIPGPVTALLGELAARKRRARPST